MLAHTEAHVAHIDGPPKDDEWQIGDNYYTAATPLAARTAAGCTVQVGSPPLISPLLCLHRKHPTLGFSGQVPCCTTCSENVWRLVCTHLAAPFCVYGPRVTCSM